MSRRPRPENRSTEAHDFAHELRGFVDGSGHFGRARRDSVSVRRGRRNWLTGRLRQQSPGVLVTWPQRRGTSCWPRGLSRNSGTSPGARWSLVALYDAAWEPRLGEDGGRMPLATPEPELNDLVEVVRHQCGGGSVASSPVGRAPRQVKAQPKDELLKRLDGLPAVRATSAAHPPPPGHRPRPDRNLLAVHSTLNLCLV